MIHSEREDSFLQKDEYLEDIKISVKVFTNKFFFDKKTFDGLQITKNEINSNLCQKIVINSKFDDECFDFIHNECLTLIPKKKGYKDQTVPWTVHCLIKILDDIKSHQVPKQFHSGMILLYFKLCYGVEIPWQLFT